MLRISVEVDAILEAHLLRRVLSRLVAGNTSAVLNVSGVVVNCTNGFDCGWDSIILYQLYTGNADIVLGLVPWTDSIANGDLGVYWVGGELQAGINIVFRNNTYDPTWNFLNPFTYIIWILLIITIVALVGFFTLLDLVVRNHPKHRLFTIPHSLWFVYAPFTSSTLTSVLPTVWGTRILAIFMWFSVIILFASYESGLMVTLLSPPINPPVYSLATLQANTGFGVTVVNGSGIDYALVKDGFTALSQRIAANPKLTYSLTLAEAAYPLLNGSTTFAIVGNSLATAYIAAQHCELNTSTPELLEQYGMGVYATTASPDFLIAMEMAYYQVKSSIQSLYTSYFTNNCTQYTSSAPLTLDSLLGLYLIMVGGAVVGLVVMISEVLYAELHLVLERKQLKHGTFYQFNKHYCARVRQVLVKGSIIIQIINRAKTVKDIEKNAKTLRKTHAKDRHRYKVPRNNLYIYSEADEQDEVDEYGEPANQPSSSNGNHKKALRKNDLVLVRYMGNMPAAARATARNFIVLARANVGHRRHRKHRNEGSSTASVSGRASATTVTSSSV